MRQNEPRTHSCGLLQVTVAEELNWSWCDGVSAGAATTKYHRPGVLKLQTFIFSQLLHFLTVEAGNQRSGASMDEFW